MSEREASPEPAVWRDLARALLAFRGEGALVPLAQQVGKPVGRTRRYWLRQRSDFTCSE